MSTTNTTDGRSPHVWWSNGHPTGPTIRGPWGEIKAFDPATGGFTIILRPQKPPKRQEAPAMPEECRYGHRGRMDLNSQGRRICLECRRVASRRAREKRAA